MKVCPQWAGCITLCSSELSGYQGFARWHACTPVWDFSVHYVLQDPILAAVPAFPPSCLYAFAKSWKLGCVKLHCARTCWGAFGDLRLCETLAGQKCCCHTHPLTPLSIHPHQRVSHPCPTIYVLCKYHVSVVPFLGCSVCSTCNHRHQHCSFAVVQSCTRSSCSPFCDGCKHPHVCFEHFNTNQRQHKISLAFPFSGLCSAEMGYLSNSSSAFNSEETAWARHLTRTPHRFTQG